MAGFTGFQDWLNGEKGKLEDFAGWAVAHDINAWAFFTMWIVTAFDPRTIGARYYDEAPKYLEWMLGHGLRPHAIGSCDQQGGPITMSREELTEHWRLWGEVIRAYWATYECQNEPYQNGWSSRWMARIDGALGARGQFADGEPPDSVGSYLDFQTKSYARKFQWARTAKDALEVSRLGLWAEERGDIPATGQPCVGREPPLGIFESTVPWSRSDDARGHADWHGTAWLLAAGSFIHGDRSNLQSCLRPGPRAQACVDAIRGMWNAGMPRDAAAVGEYSRGGMGTCPIRHSDRFDDGDAEKDASGTLRDFFMIQGNEATGICVQPGVAWPGPQGDHGWSVVEQRGPHGQIVLARR